MALAPPGPRSLAIVVNKCARSTNRSFMEVKGRGGCVQEQDCLSYRFQVIITNSPRTGSLSRVSLEGILCMAGGDVRPNYGLIVKGCNRRSVVRFLSH